jgi:hypothetical protein
MLQTGIEQIYLFWASRTGFSPWMMKKQQSFVTLCDFGIKKYYFCIVINYQLLQ